MRNVLILILFIPFMVCCDMRTYTEEEFYDSVWENSDGPRVTTMELHKDGTCNATNFDWNVIFPPNPYSRGHYKRKSHFPETFNGYWTVGKDLNGLQCIELSVINGDHYIGVNFVIENINLLSETIGDPDLCNYYYLKRTK